MKGSIRMRVFYGFLTVTLLSVVGITSISYLLIRDTLEKENSKRLHSVVETLMSSLDYAVSHTRVTEENIVEVLENKILEISDIHKKDIIIYNLKGEYLLSNKKKNQVTEKTVPQEVLNHLRKSDKRYDFIEFDKGSRGNITSSYLLLLNNMLEPVAIVYFPFYHNDANYLDAYYRYLEIMVVANILILALGIWLSWNISHGLTENIRKISDEITKINLNQPLESIKYHNDDEFTPLVNSYNRTLRLIEEQKKLLSYKEKESAWREMAKQVAHEVKNPLTPMKLLVQNFQRKFDKEDPKIEERVRRLCVSLVDQIDVITNVANAFSDYTQLPKGKDEVINVNNEIYSLVRLFDEHDEVKLSFNHENILINFDKIFFQRIMTNLVLNAFQAKDEGRKFYLDIHVTLLNKKVSITVVDNGVGMSKGKLEKVFEPNFTTKTSGMGLGLTMVKRMIEEYNGEISIRSEEGKGTSVRVVLLTNI